MNPWEAISFLFYQSKWKGNIEVPHIEKDLLNICWEEVLLKFTSLLIPYLLSAFAKKQDSYCLKCQQHLVHLNVLN
jgi:hypothetical protein